MAFSYDMFFRVQFSTRNPLGFLILKSFAWIREKNLFTALVPSTLTWPVFLTFMYLIIIIIMYTGVE